MEAWKRAWVHGPSVDPEERLPDVWEVRRSAYGLWDDSHPSLVNMKGRPLATAVRFNKVGVETGVTWAIYMRLEKDPAKWGMWVHNYGAFHRDGFINLMRERIAVVNPGHRPSAPELAALAHSVILTAIVPQAEAAYSLTPGQVPQKVRDLLGVDQELKI
jgi:hypothetical protein